MKKLITFIGLVSILSTGAQAMEIMDLKQHLGPNAPITIFQNFNQWQVQGGNPGNIWEVPVDDAYTNDSKNIVHVLHTLCAPLSIRATPYAGGMILSCKTKSN